MTQPAPNDGDGRGRARRLWSASQAVWRHGLNLLFPPRCVACSGELDDAASPPLCTACRDAIRPRQPVVCGRCGVFGPAAAAEGPCPRCRDVHLDFDGVISLGPYEERLREMVLAMKRPTARPLAAAVATWLGERQEEALRAARADLLTPIPMFWTRRLRRGTNSPEALAQTLGRQLGVPVRGLLRRRRNTLPQAPLPPRERFRNVRGAFALRKSGALDGIRILVVDDILTTGATCSEAAGVLKAAGAAWVGVVVVARAHGPDAT